MSAWGDAWGSAWGEAWGGATGPSEPEVSHTSGGPDGRSRTDYRDDEIFEIAIAVIVSGALDG